jgi:hypothetical protein
MYKIIISLFVLSIFSISSSAANTTNKTVVNLQDDGFIYTPSKIVESFDVSYPASANRNRTEGFYDIAYDVSEEGKAINVRFTRVTGVDIFESLMEISLDKWEFTPATFNGEPIAQQNLRHSYSFYLTKLANKYPEPLMRRNFATVYKQILEHLKKDEVEKAGELLVLMESASVVRFSENRRLALANYSYLNKVDGTVQDKILALERALKDHPRTESTEKLHSRIMSNLFKLYVENKQYYQAFIQHYYLSQLEFSADLLDDLAPLLNHAQAQLSSGEPISTSVKIDSSELFTQYLARPSFSIEADQKITYAELLCGDFNVKIDYSPNTVYDTPVNWEDCQLLIGAPEGSLVRISEARSLSEL